MVIYGYQQGAINPINPPLPKEKETMATRTVKEIAVEFETDPRTLRKVLRDTLPKEDQPGKGSRYAIEARSVRSLKKQFATWVEARNATPDEEPEVEAADEVSEEVTED